MSSPLLYLQVVFVFAVVAKMPAVATQSQPGCPSRCGNVDIPFPFGVGRNCSLDNTLIIICNYTYNPPRPFLQGFEVLNISLDGYLRVPPAMAIDCYNVSGERNVGYHSRLYRWGNFFISNALNQLTGIGCDTMALYSGIGDGYMTGCLSSCTTLKLVQNTSCQGIGCCHMSIPSGTTEFELGVRSFKNHTDVYEFNPCGYAFVAEADDYSFSSADLRSLTEETVASLRLTLEWSVQNLTCQQALENKSTYACQSVHSECRDSLNGRGYNCLCKVGFEGNPYLKDGCKDINECEILNSCNGVCINLPGNYACSCPKGYKGDGRKNGVGCIKNKGTGPYVIIGVTTSIGILLLVAASFMSYKLLIRRREKMEKEKFFKRNGGLLLQKQLHANDSVIRKTTIFTAAELEKATDNFNENRIIGRGGQGTVYKGMLTDGRITAVKISKQVDESQLEQFVNEIVVLSQVVHKNVVRLLGCCLETEVPLLVYEFILNGTLYDLIHKERDEFLTWNIRLRIATEVAGALAYLHSAVSVPIYHRDIKSSNILLDEKYAAKVSDFGTSKSLGDEKTHITTLVKGTFGYLDPEYFQSSQFTEKSDVYSYGVVLLELLTRQKPISQGSSGDDSYLSLATRFLASMEQNYLSTILDAQILDDKNKEEIVAVAKLAEKCLNLSGKKRPTMREVAIELERIRVSKPNLRIDENFQSLGRIVEKPETISDASFIWTTGSSSLTSVPADHPLLFNTV